MITIFKSGQLGTAKLIANVSFEKNQISVGSDDKQLLKIISNSVTMPVRVKIHGDKSVSKRKPNSIEEHVVTALREKLHSPYWIGPQEMEIESPKYKSIVGTLELEKFI